MAYSIRTKCHLNEIGYDGSADYEKQIYTKNKSWNPPPASLTIEDKLTEFDCIPICHYKLMNVQTMISYLTNQDNRVKLTPRYYFLKCSLECISKLQTYKQALIHYFNIKENT